MQMTLPHVRTLSSGQRSIVAMKTRSVKSAQTHESQMCGACEYAVRTRTAAATVSRVGYGGDGEEHRPGIHPRHAGQQKAVVQVQVPSLTSHRRA